MQDVTLLFNKETTAPDERLAILHRLDKTFRLPAYCHIGLRDVGQGDAAVHFHSPPGSSAEEISASMEWAVGKIAARLQMQTGTRIAEPAAIRVPHYGPKGTDGAGGAPAEALVFRVD